MQKYLHKTVFERAKNKGLGNTTKEGNGILFLLTKKYGINAKVIVCYIQKGLV